MTCAVSTLMVLPHQFCEREESISRRDTRGCRPSWSLRNEKRPCSPEAKCVVCPFQSAHWSRVAHPAPDNASPARANRVSLRMLIISLSSVWVRLQGFSPRDVHVICNFVKEFDRPLGRTISPRARESRALTAFSVPGALGGSDRPTAG